MPNAADALAVSMVIVLLPTPPLPPLAMHLIVFTSSIITRQLIRHYGIEK
jgi:hypothetical protein